MSLDLPRALRIAVNLAAVRSPGTRVYARGLLPAFASLRSGHRFKVFVPGDVAAFVRPYLDSSFEVHVTAVTENVGVRLLWEQLVLPLELIKWRADVVLCLMEFAPLMSTKPVLLAVHNPSPHLDDRMSSRMRRWLTRASCRRSRLVVFPSAFSAGFLGDRLGVPAERRAVVHHGTDHSRWSIESPAAAVGKFALVSGGYFLYVSQLYRYKQPDVLIRAFASWQEMCPTMHRLVLTGTAPESGYEEELLQLAADLSLGDRVRFLGHVDAEDLPALYAHCTAFVLPTTMETFGHPYVEAMASGAPVVCSDIAVAREVCGSAAEYFPPGDEEALSQIMRRLASTDGAEQRERMRVAGVQRSRRFSWEREARETLVLACDVAATGLHTVAHRKNVFPSVTKESQGNE